MNADNMRHSDRIAKLKNAEVIRSFCYACPWNCPSEVYVRDGKVVYVKGNEEAPNNIGTRCGKGMASWWITRDPDRLKFPMLRTNPKGERGQFKRISWDDAYSFIAEKLISIRDKYGPEAVVLTYHHDPNTVFYKHLLGDLYGSPNMYGHGSGCEMDRRSAARVLFGHDFPMHDFQGARYTMLWGMNMLGANQGLFESRGLLEGRKRGAKLTVVDPAFTETAQKADEWVPIRPGTDGAMALAMCREIIDAGLCDLTFIENHVEGFAGFPDHLKNNGYDADWAAPICGIDADRIRRLAREFASTKPAMSAVFKGPGYYTNGHDASRTIYILNVLTGQVDGRGNLHLKDWAPLGPPLTIPDDAKGKAGNPPLHRAMGLPVSHDLANARLPDAVLNDTPYPVRGLWVHATNPVMSDPNRDRVQKMMAGLDLAVACELLMSETALECDIVLPETSFYEMAELRQGLWLSGQVILAQPTVPPVGEAKPPYEIAKGIAKKLGWDDHFDFETWEDWAETALKDIPIGLDELKETGFWNGELKFNKLPDSLNTKTGKIELYSHVYADNGLNPYPEFTERTVHPDDEFPLQLTHQKLSMHCNIVTQNNPMLMEICPENWVEVNAGDAHAYGISDGQMIVVESPKDRIRIRAKVVEGLVPGAVSVRHGHGFGHWAMGEVAKGKGAHSNNLMDSYSNPVTGANCYNECKVRIYPCTD